STFVPEVYASEAAWQRSLAASSVRLQWDPDHASGGARVERRAIQLGLRGDTLTHYVREWIVHIEEVSGFVEEQRAHAHPAAYAQLTSPREMVYPVEDPETALRLGLSSPDA
ncbi:MAG TPA: DUF4291 family protein, partial [Gemmataceae bacterium]|nr:DUF4291 family protein [Gemmataceae bacterium]